ncbi:MAG: MoaD/ThiS family protein [Bacteroidales bacterium]|nr:MoaD/ThiS family protein [Bacteroidales bacterium]
MEISVIFFGILSEVTGIPCKTYNGISSYDDLRHRMQDDFPGIFNYNFRIAVNREIKDFTGTGVALNDGDEIACLPPFAGG